MVVAAARIEGIYGITDDYPNKVPLVFAHQALTGGTLRVNLLQALPISIAGWGVREGSFVAGFGLFGIPSKDALLLSILFGFILLLASAPGSVLWLLQKRQANESCFPLQEPVEALTLAQPE